MSAWLCIPSARPVAEVNALMAKWRERGYKIALWRDGYSPELDCDKQLFGSAYPGYAMAVNRVIEHVLREDPTCDWCVIGGDDVEPDPNKCACEIAVQCSVHFLQQGEPQECDGAFWATYRPGSFGVMQPTGDRWGEHEAWARQMHPNRPAYIDRVAGSAWIGREFAQRAYGGNGPLWPEYQHMFVDEELQAVAEKMGVFWQRRELTQFHHHWGRGPAQNMPAFLAKANSNAHWVASRELFEKRKAAGFPGSGAL